MNRADRGPICRTDDRKGEADRRFQNAAHDSFKSSRLHAAGARGMVRQILE